MTLLNETDWLLEQIITAVNGTDRAIPITLLVEGVCISGNLVSAHKFLEYTRTQVILPRDNIFEFDIQNEILARMLENTTSKCIERQNSLTEMPAFVHIENAQFIESNQTSKKPGVFWRGMIEKVSGFHLN